MVERRIDWEYREGVWSRNVERECQRGVSQMVGR